MGAITFSLDIALIKAIKSALPLEVFVETGTYKGDTVAAALPHFRYLYTVELSAELYKEACGRFAQQSQVSLCHGNSAETLKQLAPTLAGESVLYWLDAHWCVAENTAGDKSQCPLLEEISALVGLSDQSVVLIDDARLFLAPPPEPHDVTQWPTFNQIITRLQDLSDQHELMVINDVIAFYPLSCREVFVNYARKCGVDWLRASQSLTENNELRTAMEEKEAVIHTLHKTNESTESQFHILIKCLEEKEAVIQTLRGAIENAESQHLLLTRAMEEKAAIKSPEVNFLLIKGLEEKEAVIQELSRALQAYRSAFATFKYFIRPISSIKRRLRNLVTPRLGNLYHHEPRELCLPSHYRKPIAIKQAPGISIVTPSFRQAEFIERTIKSVVDQAYPNLEYHVQDAASNDGTVEILERYSDQLSGWESVPDKGQSEAINSGFSRTSGEIMAWLNSDDILLPGTLGYVADYFNRHPEIDVIYGHRILIDENDKQIGRWIVPRHDDKVLSWADYVPQETMFWRRSIWEKAGSQIDESFRFAMDWDLLIRFREAGARFARLPRFLGAFRIHPHQKTSAAISEIGFQEMDRIRERVHGRVPSSLEVRKAVLPYLLKHVITDVGWRIRNRLGVFS